MKVRHLFIGLCLILLVGGCSSSQSGEGVSTAGGGGEPGTSADPRGVPGDTGSTGSGTQSGILTAGDIDDNINFSAFETYKNSALQSDSGQTLPAIITNDRVEILVTDSTGTGAANARVTITAQGATSPLAESYCNSEGRFYFFPKLEGADQNTQFTVKARPPEADTPSREVVLDLSILDAGRSLAIALDGYNSALPASLDLTFVIDTTGSMVEI